MSLFKGSLLAFAILIATVSASAVWRGKFTEDGITGTTFTVKSTDYRYGYLRRYGPYGPLDLLEFSLRRFAGRFRFLNNGAIQDLYSYKCLNLINATNHQIVLKSACYGVVDKVPVARWYYIASRQYLVNIQTGLCLSVWSYLDRPPPDVSWVAGLNECGLNNNMILSFSNEPEWKFHKQEN